MRDVLIGEITKHLPNTTVGRSQNAPTDKQYLIRRKQRDNPDRFLKRLSGLFVL